MSKKYSVLIILRARTQHEKTKSCNTRENTLFGALLPYYVVATPIIAYSDESYKKQQN